MHSTHLQLPTMSHLVCSGGDMRLTVCFYRVLKTSNGDTVSLASFEGELVAFCAFDLPYSHCVTYRHSFQHRCSGFA